MSSTAAGEIRVLHVDDEPSFGDLTATFLEQESDRFDVETATGVDEGIAIVTDDPPDCVVSDYNMPGRNGLEFLETVRKLYSDLPFILFTGKGSEQVASDAIAADVTDYLQKGSGSEQYELLANRIRNAVQARRDAQRAGRQQELMRLTEFAGDTGGWEVDLKKETTRLTDGTRRLIGLPENRELPLEEAIAMYHPEDRPEARQALDRAIETGEQVTDTLRLETVDGDERTLDVTITPVEEGGEVTTLRGAIHDITERQQRKRDLERTETLFQHAQDSLFLIDVGETFNIERVNPAYESATGVSAEQIQGQRPREVFGADGADMEARYEECIEKRRPLTYEEQIHLDGRPTHWKTRIAPVELDGTVEYIAGSTRDVTEQREREQELKSERRLVKQALDTLKDLFYVLDRDGGLCRWNEQVSAVTGYSDAELAEMSGTDLFPEDERGTIADAIERILAGETTTVQADVHSADGDRIPHEFRGQRLTDGDGETTGLVGIGRDLTEQRRRQRRFQALVEGSNDISSVVDDDGRLRYQSPSVERALGHTPAEMVGNTAWEYIHPEDRERAIERFGDWMADPDRTGGRVEYRARHADGSWRWMEAYGSEQFDSPAVDGYVITSRDITDRKERERELEQTQALMSNMEELADVGAWEYDSETEQLVMTGGAYSILGHEPDAGLTLTEAFEQFHPADRERLTDRFEDCLERGEPYELELRFSTAGGTQRWMRARGERVDGETGTVRGYVQDITDQHDRERALGRYRTMFNELPDPVVAFDREGRYDLVNDAALEIRDTSRAELRGQTSPYLAEIRERNPEAYDELVAGTRETLSAEVTDEFPGGTRTFDCRLSLVASDRDSDSIVLITRDVTDRKECEQRLERERQRYAPLFETLPTPVLHADTEDGDPVVQSVNEAFLDTFGCDADTVVGNSLREYVLPEEGVSEGGLEQRVLPEEGLETEIRRETADGIRTYQLNLGTRTAADGGRGGYAVYTDITDREQYERELEAQNERLDEFVGIVSHDLRNPLTVAKGRLELAREECSSDHLARAADAVDRSQALVADLLTLARENRELDSTAPVDLADLARQSWETVETEAATLETDVSRRIRAEESRLQQVFENLYRNAVEHGGEDVTVRVGGVPDGFYVADTGSGIPAAQREDVFDAGYSTSDDGTGFGLRIVEQAAEAHGWAVTVTESDSGGARFEFTAVDTVDR